MSPPSDPPRYFSRRTILIGMAVALLAGTGAFAARPVYRVIKSWRATRFAREAAGLMEKQQWQAAFEKSDLAYRLDPGNIEATRVVARLCSIVKPEEALPFWMRVVASPKATPRDGCEMIRAALQGNNLEFAKNEVRKLLARWPGEPAILEAVAECHSRVGNREAAIQCARLSCAGGSAPVSARLLLARLLASSPTPAETAEGRERLWQLIAEHADGSSKAAELLARLPNLSQPELKRLTAFLSESAEPGWRGKLLLEELQIRLEPRAREQRLAALMERMNKVAPEDLIEVAGWLNRQREFARTLKLISTESALTKQELFLLRMDALAGLGRWKELGASLETGKTPLDPFLVELYAARAARELHEPGQAKAHWYRLRALTAQQPAKLLYAAQYARKIGERQEARVIYQQLAGNPSTARSAWASLIRMSEEEGDTPELRNLMEKIVALFPNDVAAQNDLVYLDLLLGRNLLKSKATAVEQMTRHPDLLSHRTTLVLACLRCGDPVAARLLCRGVDTDWRKALPGWQAVYAAVLGANGETQAAREVAQKIDLPRLKPEERVLIEPYLPKPTATPGGKSGKP